MPADPQTADLTLAQLADIGRQIINALDDIGGMSLHVSKEHFHRAVGMQAVDIVRSVTDAE